MPPCSFLALCNPLDHILGRLSITASGSALQLCMTCQASREREKEWKWERKTETDRKPEKERQKEMPKQGTLMCFVRCIYGFLCMLIWVYPHKSGCLRGSQTCEIFLELTYSMWVSENQTQDLCKSSACSYPLSYISYFGTEVSTYCISADPLMILFYKQQTKFAQPVT